MAAAAVTFANYFEPLRGSPLRCAADAAIVIAIFTAINALGVRTGTTTQNAFMIRQDRGNRRVRRNRLLRGSRAAIARGITGRRSRHGLIGLAMVPVLFAYSGWQTSSFMTAELREPNATLPRGLLVGVAIVVALYLAVNAACLHVLGNRALGADQHAGIGYRRARVRPIGRALMADVIAISTLGFLSNQILTSPRVYFQMAADGTFFKPLARVNAQTHAPVIAILAQGAVADRRFALFQLQPDSQLRHVERLHFFGLAAIALIIFRSRDAPIEKRLARFSACRATRNDDRLSRRRMVHRGRYGLQFAARHVDRRRHSADRVTGLLAFYVAESSGRGGAVSPISKRGENPR